MLLHAEGVLRSSTHPRRRTPPPTLRRTDGYGGRRRLHRHWLLLGSGAAMEIAGPAAILSFIAAAFINWTVAMALGELACAHPEAGSFGVYGELYLNSFAGTLVGLQPDPLLCSSPPPW